MLSLINDVLDMSRIENGSVRIEYTVVHLPDILHDLNTIIQESVHSKQQELYIDTQDVFHEDIITDKLRLTQVLLNIISNAIKYTPEGHSIYVEVHEAVSENPSKIRYIFSCEDTGIGMSEEYLPHVYEEFSREHTTTENKVQGTGLGLSIIKSMIELMGGSIQVESRQGIGTKFTVDLSFDIASKEEVYGSEDTIESSAIHTIKGKRILLVEDNELNLEVAASLLEMKGLTIESACNGLQALEKFCSTPVGYYDAVLMDIRMPVMDGLEAARNIRLFDKSDAQTIPIIAMTANAFDEDVEKSHAAGMNAHLAKPIDPEKLFAVLQEFI